MNRVSIGSDNGLSPIRRQAIIQTNAGLLSIGTLGTSFSEFLIKIQNFSFTKLRPKMSSARMAAILSRGRWVNIWNTNCVRRLYVHQARYPVTGPWARAQLSSLHSMPTILLSPITGEPHVSSGCRSKGISYNLVEVKTQFDHQWIIYCYLLRNFSVTLAKIAFFK